MPPTPQSANVAKRKPAVDTVEALHERMMANVVASSGVSSSTAPAQYLQDAIADVVEHRVSDPIFFIFHHLRRLKLTLTTEGPSQPSVGGSGGGVNGRLGPSAFGSSATQAPTGFKFFDRLHRYVFQHEGGRAMRTSFFIFQHADEQTSSSGQDLACASHNAECNDLAFRASLFSCFNDLFFVAQRMDQAMHHPAAAQNAPHFGLPVTDLSRVPYRLVLAFCLGLLEEQLLFIATPQTLLACTVSLLRLSAKALLPTSNAPLYDMTWWKALQEWAIGISVERATLTVRAVVKVLEDLLRCGPTTIVTATTRKKRDGGPVAVPVASALAFSQEAAAPPPQCSNWSATDEAHKDSIVRTVEALCGAVPANSVAGAKPVKSVLQADLARLHVNLQTFEFLVTFVWAAVKLVRQVSLPTYALLQSRCFLVPDTVGLPLGDQSNAGTSAVPHGQAVEVLRKLIGTPAFDHLVAKIAGIESRLLSSGTSADSSRSTRSRSAQLEAWMVCLENAKGTCLSLSCTGVSNALLQSVLAPLMATQ